MKTAFRLIRWSSSETDGGRDDFVYDAVQKKLESNLNACQQRVPFGKGTVLGDASVGAGFGQPVVFTDCFGGKHGAIGNLRVTVFVVAAGAGPSVEQRAGVVEIKDFAGIGILDFMHAAQRAAVAQRFPLFGVELFQGFLMPEIRFSHVLCRFGTI